MFGTSLLMFVDILIREDNKVQNNVLMIYFWFRVELNLKSGANPTKIKLSHFIANAFFSYVTNTQA